MFLDKPPEGHRAYQVMCARRMANNKITVCEDRKVEAWESAQICVPENAPICPHCHRPLATTFGIHGDAFFFPDGTTEPDMTDPRNRGLDVYPPFRCNLNRLWWTRETGEITRGPT